MSRVKLTIEDLYMKRDAKGFSLIELMVTVAIVAILAAIAFPSYQSQVQQSRRRDAEGALVSFANAMERFFTTNNTYLGAAGTQAIPTNTGAPWVFSTQAPVDGGTAVYTLTISAATASTYTLSATPVTGGPQASDSCGTLTLSSTGAKNATTANCW